MSKIAMTETIGSVERRIRPPQRHASVKPFENSVQHAIMEFVGSFRMSGSTDPIKDPRKMFLKTVLRLVLIPAFLLTPAALLADTNCEEGTGPLNTAQPQGMTPQAII